VTAFQCRILDAGIYVMRSWLVGLTALVIGVSPAAAATDIASDPAKAWKHKPTGVALPATLAGLKRTKLAYFSAPVVDVAGDYWSADGSDTITVFLYRNVTGSVPLWFDRSRFYLMNLPDKYGTVRATGIRPFSPRGQAVASGLLETYEVSKGGRATGLVVLPFKGFYVKVRASSKTRDLAELESLLLDAVNAFDWTDKSATHAAAPMADCGTPLAARAPAKLIEAKGDDRMMAGILGGLFAQVASSQADKKAAAEPPVAYCREPGHSTLSTGLYRPGASSDHYMLAVLDGGRAISAGRNDLAALIDNANSGSKAPRYTVSFHQLDRVATFGDFASLPLPDQVIEHVEQGRPVSIAQTWGKDDKQVTIVTE
jgi:hypothetical protein